MSTTRDFSFTLTPAEGQDAAELARRARKVLGWACEGDHRITCQGVDGEMYGVVQVNVQVSGKDRWNCGQLAQDLIQAVTIGVKDPAGLDVESRQLPTHTNRGYGHGRTKRWRERRSN
jgi:hypothetical protein